MHNNTCKHAVVSGGGNQAKGMARHVKKMMLTFRVSARDSADTPERQLPPTSGGGVCIAAKGRARGSRRQCSRSRTKDPYGEGIEKEKGIAPFP